ncbi:MAG: DUF4388 domain-containing protein, partial [Acidobacteriota bacterium]|nr:DUF4388 domain-containing protein [Acidobacteriota bacterium]
MPTAADLTRDVAIILRPMSFQGSLRELQLADILQLVSTSGKTGKFVLVHDDEQGELYLKQGR